MDCEVSDSEMHDPVAVAGWFSRLSDWKFQSSQPLIVRLRLAKIMSQLCSSRPFTPDILNYSALRRILASKL